MRCGGTGSDCKQGDKRSASSQQQGGMRLQLACCGRAGAAITAHQGGQPVAPLGAPPDARPRPLRRAAEQLPRNNQLQGEMLDAPSVANKNWARVAAVAGARTQRGRGLAWRVCAWRTARCSRQPLCCAVPRPACYACCGAAAACQRASSGLRRRPGAAAAAAAPPAAPPRRLLQPRWRQLLGARRTSQPPGPPLCTSWLTARGWAPLCGRHSSRVRPAARAGRHSRRRCGCTLRERRWPAAARLRRGTLPCYARPLRPPLRRCDTPLDSCAHTCCVPPPQAL